MFGIIANFISSVLTILFPIYASYKALRTRDPAQTTPWLMYWAVISTFLVLESYLSLLLFFVPFYAWFRLLFLSYLVLPQTQGAKVLYQSYLDPFLHAHEDQIEQGIIRVHDAAIGLGIAYYEKAIDFVRTKLGLPPVDRVQQEPAPKPSAQGTSAGALAAALLARFNMPATGDGAGAASEHHAAGDSAAPSSSDLFGQFASTVSAAASRVMNAGAPGGTAAGPAGVVPGHLKDASQKEQAEYISQQKENLASLLRAYESAQSHLGGGGEGATGVDVGEGHEGVSKRRSSGGY